MSDSNQKYVVHMLPMDSLIMDDEFNCRGEIQPLDVMTLMESIKKNGLETPITVQPHPDMLDAVPPKYRVLTGHRRTTAMQLLKFKEVPCFVRVGLTDKEARVMNLCENMERCDLDPVQSATAVQKLMDNQFNEFEIAKAIGKSRGWVQTQVQTIKLMQKVPEMIDAIRNKEINKTQVRDLYTFSIKPDTSNDKLLEMVRSIREGKQKGNDNVAVNKLRAASTNPETKRLRTASDMERIQNLLFDTFGPCLATRAVAWCGGFITDREVLDTIDETCQKTGRHFERPEIV